MKTMKEKAPLKVGDLITLKDIRNLNICSKPFWVRRFNKMFPYGCTLTITNLKKFFYYTYRDTEILKKLNSEDYSKESNISFGLESLVQRKGTTQQYLEVEDIVCICDDNNLIYAERHDKLFKNFLTVLKREALWTT